MKNRDISLICFVVLALSLCLPVFGQDRDHAAVSIGSQIRVIFGTYTCNIFCFVTFSIVGVACLVMLYSGFMYISSSDAPGRDALKKRVLYVFVGLVVFVAMIPVVNYLTGFGSANLSPFGCNCLNNSVEIAEPVVVGTTLPGLNVYIVKPKEGEELDMDKLTSFLCVGYGGTPPYQYKWTSDRDGAIGFADTFMANLSRGNHTITVELTDNVGNYTSAQVHVGVIVPKPKPN